MIRKSLLTLVITTLPLWAASTFGINQLGVPQSPNLAKGISLGGANATLLDDAHSLTNPAKMAFNNKTSFAAGLIFESVEYGKTTESGFNIPYISMSIPIGPAGNISLAYFQKYGYDFHYEQLVGADSLKTTIEGAIAEIVPSWSITLFDRFAIGVNYHHPMGATQVYEENYQRVKNTTVSYESDAQIGYVATSVQFSGKGWALYLGYQPEYTIKQLYSGDIAFKENVQDTSLYFTDANKNQSEVIFKTEKEQTYGAKISVGGSMRLNDRHILSVDGDYQRWDGINAVSPLTVVTEKRETALNDAFSAGLGYQLTPSRRAYDFYLKRVSYRAGVQYGQLYVDDATEVKGSVGFGFPLGTRRVSNLDVSFYYGIRGLGADDPQYEEHIIGGAISFTGFGDWGKSSRRYR
ncbi:MAG: hypothetical protein OCD01_06875 [Fibrobacterales bacterium]